MVCMQSMSSMRAVGGKLSSAVLCLLFRKRVQFLESGLATAGERKFSKAAIFL